MYLGRRAAAEELSGLLDADVPAREAEMAIAAGKTSSTAFFDATSGGPAALMNFPAHQNSTPRARHEAI